MTRYFRRWQSARAAAVANVVPLLRDDLERKSIEDEVFAIVCDDAIDRDATILGEEFQIMSYQLDAMSIFNPFVEKLIWMNS